MHPIVAMLANGDTIDDLLDTFPSIERADVLACLANAAWLAEEQVVPLSMAGGSA